MFIALILGGFIGFISAIPVAGPISAVVFSRGIRGKYAQGRWIAVGAAFFEALYAFFAFWGFHHFLGSLKIAITVSNTIAAILLFALGIYFFSSQKMRLLNVSHSQKEKEPAAFFLGAGMGAANFSVIATWGITASTLQSMNLFELTLVNSALFGAGVWIGIIAWFSLLLKILAKHRNQINPKRLDRGLKAVGILLFSISLWMFFRLFQVVFGMAV